MNFKTDDTLGYHAHFDGVVNSRYIRAHGKFPCELNFSISITWDVLESFLTSKGFVASTYATYAHKLAPGTLTWNTSKWYSEELDSYCAIVRKNDDYYELNLYAAEKQCLETLYNEIAGSALPSKPCFHVLIERSNYGNTSYNAEKLDAQGKPFGTVELLYGADFYHEQHEPTLKLLDDTTSGIILLQGKPGTGKSTYIEFLCHQNLKKDLVYVDRQMMESFDATKFMQFLIEASQDRRYQGFVFVIEDCEALLTDRKSNLPLILNISDGVLSGLFKTHFVLTCNCNIDDIDPAVTRKGRLLKSITFTKLSQAHAQRIIDAREVDYTATGAMTHAEVFHLEKPGYVHKQKIGLT